MQVFVKKNGKRVCWVCMAVLFCAGIWTAKKQVNATQQTAYDYIVTDAEDKVNPTDKESDTKGIQKTLDKTVGSAAMVTIYFPAGDYYIDKPMRVYSNTHIILDENATIHRMDSMVDRSILHNVDQDGKMDVVGGYDMSENIILEGGTWDGGNTELATDAADVIRFDHAKNITIKNCVIKNVYDCHIIELVGVKNGLVTGCTLSGFRYQKGHENDYTYAREAIQLESAWTNNESNKADSKSAWASGSVVDGTSCQQVTVTDNTFIDLPCGVGQHHYTKSGKYRNQDITISNNVFTCSDTMKYCKTAITCCGTNNLIVENNTIKGPYRFSIHVIASSDVVIQKNQMEGISMNGIMINTGEITAIRENSLKNIGKHGISVSEGTVKEITKNTISNVKQNGICVTAGKITNIQENTVKTAAKHGISVTGGTVGTGKSRSKGIQSNTITNCKQNGITVSGKGKVSSIGKNKISGIKNNGISLTEKAKVYWIEKNTIKNCKKHGIWNGTSTKTKIKGNKGKIK